MKIAFTIATANYLAQAKTVADSLLQHNPEYTFFVVLLDRIAEIDLAEFSNITLIEIEQLKLADFPEMVKRYSIFELSNSLKPYCADFFLRSYDAVEVVVYTDSDIFFYSSIEQVVTLCQASNIILTPHMFHPPPNDGLSLKESDFLNAGIYNGGFFAVSNSPTTYEFLDWWKERMRTQCFVNFAQGLFVDQIWLNFVPLYFKNVKVWDNLGCNVAYWNLHERTLSYNSAGEAYINDKEPLVFFHFSGYNFDKPQDLSSHQNRYTLEEFSEIFSIFNQYREKVESNGYIRYSLIPCYFTTSKYDQSLAQGVLVIEKERSLIRRLKDRIKNSF